MRRARSGSRAARRACAALLGIAAALLSAELVLRALPSESLGFVYARGVFTRPPEFTEDERRNALGFHAAELPPAEDRAPQVLLLGDSYVAALSVPLEETVGQRLERNRLALLGTSVTLAEAARAVGVSTTAAARGAMTTVSLGTEWADDLSVEADDDPMGCGTDFLALLHPTHAHILAARHGIGRPMRTLVQLATEMHHSPSTIARWERAALAEARTLLSAERMTMSRPEPVSRARRSGASSAASPAR